MPLIKNNLIKIIAATYQIDLQEAEKSRPEDYQTFNAFFTRSLKNGARVIESTGAGAVVSPVDGTLSEFGRISGETLIQAKGRYFSLTELLGGRADLCRQFVNGSFMTIYLSPQDYHRIHMPLDGQLTEMLHVPGDLFSVNNASVKTIPSLFARNERVINIFSSAAGTMALIQVGAIFVSSIETVWHGVVTPPRKRFIQHWRYSQPHAIEQGKEMGRFNMGSTVILLFAEDKINFSSHLLCGNRLQLGNKIGTIHHGN